MHGVGPPVPREPGQRAGGRGGRSPARTGRARSARNIARRGAVGGPVRGHARRMYADPRERVIRQAEHCRRAWRAQTEAERLHRASQVEDRDVWGALWATILRRAHPLAVWLEGEAAYSDLPESFPDGTNPRQLVSSHPFADARRVFVAPAPVRGATRAGSGPRDPGREPERQRTHDACHARQECGRMSLARVRPADRDPSRLSPGPPASRWSAARDNADATGRASRRTADRRGSRGPPRTP